MEELVLRCAEARDQVEQRVQRDGATRVRHQGQVAVVVHAEREAGNEFLGTPTAHQRRAGRVGDVVDAEVVEPALAGGGHVVLVALGEEPQVVDAELVERARCEEQRGDRVQVALADRHRRQLDGVLGIIDVVDLEATVTAAARLVGHHQDVARVHRRYAHVIRAVTCLRRDDADERRLRVVAHVPHPDSRFGVTAAR